MLRMLKFTAVLTAVSALGVASAAADDVIYQRVYSAPAPQVVYTNPAPAYVVQTPQVVTRVVPRTVVVPAPQQVVTERYVVRQTPTYVTPQPGYSQVVEPQVIQREVVQPRVVQTYSQVVVRPANCGTYHYWDGAACVDARDRGILVTQRP